MDGGRPIWQGCIVCRPVGASERIVEGIQYLAVVQLVRSRPSFLDEFAKMVEKVDEGWVIWNGKRVQTENAYQPLYLPSKMGIDVVGWRKHVFE